MTVYKKTVALTLPICIWTSINLYILLFKNVVQPLFNLITDNSNGSSYPWLIVLLILINIIFQVGIICLLTIVATIKFDFSVKKMVLSILFLYVLFAIYHQPSLYLLVYTDEWHLIFAEHPMMHSWKASIFITLQFGVVMLITTLVATRKKHVD